MKERPGTFIRAELDARGWDQVTLAWILDRPPRLISELVNGKRSITARTAHGLAAAFGNDAHEWMQRQTAYDLSRARDLDPGLPARLSALQVRKGRIALCVLLLAAAAYCHSEVRKA